MGQRKSHPYLRLRGNRWWVRVKVPAKLRGLYTSPHVERTLGTDSSKDAKERAPAVVALIKQEFRARERTAAGALPADIREALEHRDALRAASDDKTAEILDGLIRDRAYVIEAKAGEDRALNFAAIAFDTKGKTLREAFGDWLDAEEFRGGTKAKYTRALEELLSYLDVSDAVPMAVTMERARGYVDWLNTKGKTPKGTPLDPATKRARVNALSGFWKYMERRQLVPHEVSLWTRHEIAGSRQKRREVPKERPYKAEEIIALCDGPERKENAHYTKRTAIELTALGLYTGCRLEELCVRTLVEVEPIKGGYMLHIRDAKSAAGNRDLPVVHPIAVAVIKRRIGKRTDPREYLFADFVPGGPDNKRSWQVQKALGDYRRDVGLPPGVNFHSTRKSFATRMEELRVDQRWAERYFGHKPPGIMAKVYSRPEVLLNVAKAIKYPAPVEKALRTALGVT